MRTLSVQHRTNLSLAHKGQKSWSKGLTAEEHPSIARWAKKNTGKTRSSESVERIRKGAQKRVQEGRVMSPEHMAKMRSVRKENARVRGDYFTEEGRQNHSRNVSDALTGRSRTDKEKNNVGLGGKRVWDSYTEEEKAWRIKRFKEGCLVAPNKPEKILEQVLEDMFSGGWKFVGGGDVWIGRLCPDFISMDRSNRVIEMFGDYWHKGEDERIRIAKFKAYGYSCLVVWERELQDIELVKSKIRKFEEAYNNGSM